MSLVPSVTETLRAWGIDPVACTRFCERPDLPTVGGTKNPDVAAIEALAPDLVVMDEEENRRDDHDALVAGGVEVLATAVRSLDDLDRDMARLADRLGSSWTSVALEVAPYPDGARRLAVAVPIWRHPWMWLGAPTYGHSLLEACGARNVMADAAGERYPPADPPAVARRAPEVVLAPDEPYRFGERHRTDLEVAAPTVVFVDGKDLFWWGARTATAARRLAAVLSVGGA